MVITRIEEFLSKRLEDKLFSGAAVNAGTFPGKPVSVYQGTVSRDSDTPVHEKTFFDLQSLTKSLVTSPLVHVLVNTGKLSLSEKIQTATVEELLCHSAGFTDEDLDFRIKNPHAAWKKISSAEPKNPPGKSIEYADLNYRILGRYLELKTRASLETLARDHLWSPLGISDLTYIPYDTFNTSGVRRSHGRIDDEKVFEIGSVTGDDGLFGTAEAITEFLRAVFEERGPLQGYKKFLRTFQEGEEPSDFFSSLRYGHKNAGWEINSFPASYAGVHSSPDVIEKSGGAGTFIWLDLESGKFLVYLTNHGKPEPFKRKSWNKLVESVAPDELSEILFSLEG